MLVVEVEFIAEACARPPREGSLVGEFVTGDIDRLDTLPADCSSLELPAAPENLMKQLEHHQCASTRLQSDFGATRAIEWGISSAGRLGTTVRQFLHDTRAGATALVAAAVTVMTVGATALIVDHTWLVDQRDVLKTATDAGSVATTLEMIRQLALQPNISDSDLEAHLEPIARRYIELNLAHLAPDRLAQAKATLVVDVVVQRDQATVDVSAAADLGGTLMSKHMPFFGNQSGSQRVSVASLSERVTTPVEVALAIDYSESMAYRMDRNEWPPRGIEAVPSRMETVKMAATTLVGIIDPDAEGRVAIGVVPWSAAVRLEADAAAEWESNGWARYPTRRVYGVPYYCKGSNCSPPPAVEQTLAPVAPQPWRGCLDSHRMGSVGTGAALPVADDWLTPPARNAFAQGFYVSTFGAAYECAGASVRFSRQTCYSGSAKSARNQYKMPVQWPCMDSIEVPTILPLSTDNAAVEQAIAELDAVGARTYSGLGVLWAQRLLEHSWNDVWGGDVHPMDSASRDGRGIRKAIVLLTDGDDTQCGSGNVACEDSEAGVFRTDACAAAKAAGSEIFVVTAMAPSFMSTALAESLRACSSEADHPDGSYVFLSNATPQDVQDAFADIANQLRRVRKVY